MRVGGQGLRIDLGTPRLERHILGPGPATTSFARGGAYETHFGGVGRGSAKTRVVLDGRKKIRKFPEELSSRVIPEPSGCLETVRGSETTWGGVWRPRTLIP